MHYVKEETTYNAQTNASLVIQEVRFGDWLESSLEKVVTDMHVKFQSTYHTFIHV